jgi:signal recognition particle subunit SRP54
MDFNDLRQQIIELKKMGPVRGLTARIPDLDQRSMDWGGMDFDREINRIQGIIESMTVQERSYPFLMTVPTRCLRIAEGAGVKPSEVSRLFTQFKAMSDMTLWLQRGGWRNV